LNTTVPSPDPDDDEEIDDNLKNQDKNISIVESNYEELVIHTVKPFKKNIDVETEDIIVVDPDEEEELIIVDEEEEIDNNPIIGNELIEGPEISNNNNFEIPADEETVYQPDDDLELPEPNDADDASFIDTEEQKDESDEDGYDFKFNFSGAIFGTIVIIIVLLLSLFWITHDGKLHEKLEESKKLHKRVKELHRTIRKKRKESQKIYEAEIVELHHKK
jgi:hypothetical protein